MENNIPKPDYASMHVWECYMKELDVEYKQSIEEGKDVTAFKPLFDAVISLPNDEKKKKLADA